MNVQLRKFIREMSDVFMDFTVFYASKMFVKLNIAVTFRCNFKCRYCNIWKIKPMNELSTKDFKLIFERNKPFWISITGGEPFLRKDISKIISLAAANGTKLLSINTNGFLTEKIIKDIEESILPVNHLIVISLHGKKEIHEKLTGIKDSFDRAVNTFFKLRDLGYKTKFEFLLVKENYNMLFDLVDELGLRVNDFVITFLNISKYYNNFSVGTDYLRKGELVEFLKEYLRRYRTRSLFDIIYKEYLKGAIDFYLKGKRRTKCLSGIKSFWILPDGSVYNCIFEKFYLGNIKENNYRIPKKKKIYKKVLACNGCWTPCEAFPSIVFRFFRFM